MDNDVLTLPEELKESVESYPLNKAAIARFVKVSGSSSHKETVIDSVFSILSKKKGSSLIQESGVSYLVKGEEMAIYRGIGSNTEEFIHERKIKFDEPRKRLAEAKEIEVPEPEQESKIGLMDILDELYSDQIPGGKGDKAKPSDFKLKQILQGIIVELEHTDDEMKALEIAIDHLSEDPNYYDKLKKVHTEDKRVTDGYGLPVL